MARTNNKPTQKQQIEWLTTERDFYKELLQDSQKLVHSWINRCDVLEKENKELKAALSKIGAVEILQRLQAQEGTNADHEFQTETNQA